MYLKAAIRRMESAHCVWSGVGTGSAARAHLIGTAAVAIGLSCWATGVVTAWSGARATGEREVKQTNNSKVTSSLVELSHGRYEIEEVAREREGSTRGRSGERESNA